MEECQLKESSRASDRPGGLKLLKRWLSALFFALVVAWVIKSFVFEAFRIPTPSMEDTLLVGDFVVVSKLAYGARTPVSLGVPFTNWYFRDMVLPFTRLPGFSSIERGDVVVFNFPDDDRILDRKQHYIKRIMALPGDSIEVRNKRFRVNGRPAPGSAEMKLDWIITLSDSLTSIPSATLKVLNLERLSDVSPTRILIRGSALNAEKLTELGYVQGLQPYIRRGSLTHAFPDGFGYNLDTYGPLYVPAAGDTVWLTPQVLATYSSTVAQHEKASLSDLAGESADSADSTGYYVFKKNYYFVAGDNRDFSADSRIWGFVPEDHIVGRVSWIYFSWDGDSGVPRMSRIFRPVR